jgi:hypothetical protein
MANFCRFIHYLLGKSETHETLAKAAMCCFFNLANPISTIRNLLISIRTATKLRKQKLNEIWLLEAFQMQDEINDKNSDKT